jgi:acyl-CoA thioester hydrolase
MITECSLRVRSYECDSYGHVNNANYLNYLEYARYEFLKAVGFDYPAAIKAGYGVYVARIEINYKMPAFPDDELLIRSWPVKKGAVSGIIAQQILRGTPGGLSRGGGAPSGALIVEANVTWAFVDSRGVPTKLPPEWDLSGLRPSSDNR